MLVDDQHLLRMGFRLILEGEEDLEVVAEAADGIEALQTLNALPPGQRPDVVLMDVRMPRMDGIEATTKVVAQFPQTRVIILTTFDLDEYAFSGLQAGASAFLLKDVTPEDLVHAVRVVAEGDAVVAPRITQRLLEVYLRGGARIAPSAAQGSGGGAAHGAAGGARGAAAGAAA
ncbi:response regulator transcription factor, partial [Nesterenkonia sp. E16_7]